MSNLYFPICAFMIALLLIVVFFSKKRVSNLETKIYSVMVIATFINVTLNLAAVYIVCFLPQSFYPAVLVMDRLALIQYIIWANLLFFYVAEVSFRDKRFYKRLKRRLIKACAAADIIVGLLALSLPSNLHNADGVMYTYGPAVDVTLILCGVYLVLIFLSIIFNIKNILNRKYFPIFALVFLGVIVIIVRNINPGLLVVPMMLAYINLIMFFTIENPDIKLVEAQEEANRQLKRMNETKDEFMSLASHQLRTPLTSIRGYASMLTEGDFGKLNDLQKHAIREIESSSERMVFLVRDFLNISRIQAGNFVLERMKTNLPDLLREDIEQLSAMAETHDIKLVLKIRNEAQIPELNVDRERIGEIMANLIDNAIFYSKPGKSVEISLALVEDYVEFKVIDHGIGVPAKEQQDLFTKFFRASNARTMRPDGTGIGLFLVQKVIKEHSGTVVFHSVQGKGSTFGFRLPVKKNSVKDDEPSQSANPAIADRVA